MAEYSTASSSISSPHDAPSFEQIGVDTWLCRQCSSLAMRHPTPIQSKCIPPILAGAHVLGGAATGSGKTAAFALPMLQMLSKDMYGVFGLILTPSRELAYQLTDQFLALGAPVRLRSLLLIGGVSHNEQVTALQARPHIVFATPGRLCFLFRNFEESVSASLRYLRFLVLDEADRLTEGELGKDVHWLLSTHLKPTPRRQVLLFSATLHPRLMLLQEEKKGKDADIVDEEAEEEPCDSSWLPVLGITKDSRLVVAQVGNQSTFFSSASSSSLSSTPAAHLQNSKKGKNEKDSLAAKDTYGRDETKEDEKRKRKREEKGKKNPEEEEERSEQERSMNEMMDYHLPKGLFNGYLFLPNMVKLPYLVATLRSLGKMQTTIVFVNSCLRTELVHLVLQLLGFPVCRLHSLLRQQQRLDSLASFKLGLARIMVATDIASRGLDIPEVQVVVHYDVPKEAATFVHRVGRTARAGREGLSVALITECDVRPIKRIEKQIGSQLTAWTKESKGKDEEAEEEITAKQEEEALSSHKKNKKEKKTLKKDEKEQENSSVARKRKAMVTSSSSDATNEKATRKSSSDNSNSSVTPAIEEEEVVKILDEVSAAKVTALQQVQETLGSRAETLKEQAAALKERKKRRKAVGAAKY